MSNKCRVSLNWESGEITLQAAKAVLMDHSGSQAPASISLTPEEAKEMLKQFVAVLLDFVDMEVALEKYSMKYDDSKCLESPSLEDDE